MGRYPIRLFPKLGESLLNTHHHLSAQVYRELAYVRLGCGALSDHSGGVAREGHQARVRKEDQV